MSFMQRYLTGRKVPIKLNIVHLNGQRSELDAVGEECSARAGDLFMRLIELQTEKRRRSAWWYVFFNGRYATLEIDAEIRELVAALNRMRIEWSTYGN